MDQTLSAFVVFKRSRHTVVALSCTWRKINPRWCGTKASLSTSNHFLPPAYLCQWQATAAHSEWQMKCKPSTNGFQTSVRAHWTFFPDLVRRTNIRSQYSALRYLTVSYISLHSRSAVLASGKATQSRLPLHQKTISTSSLIFSITSIPSAFSEVGWRDYQSYLLLHRPTWIKSRALRVQESLGLFPNTYSLGILSSS